MANRVVHFEIPATDIKRALDFYAKAFGWKAEQQGPDLGGYVVVTSGPPIPTDIKDIGINGGIYETKEKDVNAFRAVIGVDDIDKAIADVKSAGGKIMDDNKAPNGTVLGEKMDIPGIGIWAKCEDSEGNIFSVLQPSMEMVKKESES